MLQDYDMTETIAIFSFMFGSLHAKGKIAPGSRFDHMQFCITSGIDFWKQNEDTDWDEAEENYIEALDAYFDQAVAGSGFLKEE